MIGVMILAAGNGTRYGKLKQFEEVGGKQIIDYTIDIYKNIAGKILLVLPNGYDSKQYDYVIGGKTRYDSIIAGFYKMRGCSKILIVDAVRCNTKKELIIKIIKGLDDYDCIIPSLPTIETQFKSYPYRLHGCQYYEIREVFDKTMIRQCQTPEGYTWECLSAAICRGDSRKGFLMAYHLVLCGGWKLGWVEGDSTNIKITYPIDLKIFEMLKKQSLDTDDKYFGYGVYETPSF